MVILPTADTPDEKAAAHGAPINGPGIHSPGAGGIL